MQVIKIKPLSVNDARKGRRFKTDHYKKYEKVVPMLLKKIDIPSGPLRLDFVFGFSNSSSDYDNPIKQIQDILARRYGFNDSRIYFGTQRKVNVKKGQEFIAFEISKFDETEFPCITIG